MNGELERFIALKYASLGVRADAVSVAVVGLRLNRCAEAIFQ